MDRTTLLLLLRKQEDATSSKNIITWLACDAPHWVVVRVCRLLGDWSIAVNADGLKWRVCGRLHRVHGPAVFYFNGSQEWWQNGALHRVGDKPAVIWSNGAHFWWQNGERHRGGDAPASIFPDGSREWWRNGVLHRDGDMPAVQYANGLLEWWLNGEYVRSQLNAQTI